MEVYLNLFEQVVRKLAESVGAVTANAQAQKAGLGVSRAGHIVSCAGNPQVVLLRLIRSFIENGHIAPLMDCRPLLDEILNNLPVEQPEGV